MRIGGHFSHGTGLNGPFDVALEHEANCFQMFIGGNSTRPYDVGSHHAEEFKSKKQDLDMMVAAHGPYLPNVCAAHEPDRIAWSIQCIMDYMRAADKLDIEFMVFHAGSHKGSGSPAGFECFVESTHAILQGTKDLKVKLLWENTAGGGTQIGHVEAVAQCVKLIDNREQLGMCLDTTHSYADGHALDADRYRANFWNEYKDLTDWVHFNNPDRKVQRGSHLDRHRQDWLNAKWPVDVMINIAREWGPDAPLCMEADPTSYEVNFMLLDEAGLLP